MKNIQSDDLLESSEVLAMKGTKTDKLNEGIPREKNLVLLRYQAAWKKVSPVHDIR